MKENEVYVVVAIIDMSDCTDEAGNSAGDSEEIIGVFSTLEAAEERRDQLNLTDAQLVSDCNCNPTDYVVRTWKLEDVTAKQAGNVIIDEPCMLSCPVTSIFAEAKEQLKSLVTLPNCIGDPKVQLFANINQVFDIVNEAERKCIKETVSLGTYKQVAWERDIAVEQLGELGYSLGEKITGNRIRSKAIDELVKQLHKEFHNYRIDGKAVDCWLDRLVDETAQAVKDTDEDWIPCVDQMPETHNEQINRKTVMVSEEVQVTYLDADDVPQLGTDYTFNGKWFNYGERVTAWQPQVKPYTGPLTKEVK